MHRTLSLGFDYSNAVRGELVQLMESLTDEQLEQRESPTAWNPRQILNHLHLTEKSITMAIMKFASGARETGLVGEPLDRSLEERFKEFDLPILGEKFEAPGRLVPSDLPVQESLVNLAASRSGLVEAVEASDGLPLDDIKFPHPIIGPLSVPTWIVFVGLHEKRHMNQIRRTVGLASV